MSSAALSRLNSASHQQTTQSIPHVECFCDTPAATASQEELHQQIVFAFLWKEEVIVKIGELCAGPGRSPNVRLSARITPHDFLSPFSRQIGPSALEVSLAASSKQPVIGFAVRGVESQVVEAVENGIRTAHTYSHR